MELVISGTEGDITAEEGSIPVEGDIPVGESGDGEWIEGEITEGDGSSEAAPAEELPIEDELSSDGWSDGGWVDEEIVEDDGSGEEPPADETPVEGELPPEEWSEDGSGGEEAVEGDYSWEEPPVDELPVDEELPVEEWIDEGTGEEEALNGGDAPVDEIPSEEIPTDGWIEGDWIDGEVSQGDWPIDAFPVDEVPADDWFYAIELEGDAGLGKGGSRPGEGELSTEWGYVTFVKRDADAEGGSDPLPSDGLSIPVELLYPTSAGPNPGSMGGEGTTSFGGAPADDPSLDTSNSSALPVAFENVEQHLPSAAFMLMTDIRAAVDAQVAAGACIF